MGRSKTGRSSLQRSAPPTLRQAGRRFYVFCEGQRTEPEYLLGLRRALRTPLLQIEIVESGASPSTLVAKATRHLRELRRARDTQDEVWVLFDRDAHADWDRACDQARANQLQVARSNPCFELWLLLHFRAHSAPIERHQVRALLREHLPSYDKGVVERSFFSDLLHRDGSLARDSRCLTALARAEVLSARAAGLGTDGNPSTEVHELVRRILAQRPGGASSAAGR